MDFDFDFEFPNPTPNAMLIDLSHTIHHEMITYRGLPGPVISDYLSRADSRTRYEAGTEFQIGKIEMVANTGTYVDSPFHRYAEGADLSALKLESIADLDAIVLRRSDSRERTVTKTDVADLNVRGRALLIHTGWDKLWRTDEYSNGMHPFLSTGAAEYLVRAGVALVGIDSFNIDDTAGGQRPAHTILLQAGIPIVEHLCRLSELPDWGCRFFAVPPRIRGMGSFAVRAFAIVEGEKGS